MKLINQSSIFLVLAVCYMGLTYASSIESDPKAVVQKMSDDVVLILGKEDWPLREDLNRIYHLADEHILPHFDFDRMSYLTLGKLWKQLSEQQQQDFQQEFKQLLVSTYIGALLEFSADTDVIFYEGVKVSPKNKNVVIVLSGVRRTNSTLVNIAYRMYRTEGVWRIYDVSVNGVSLVVNYRANFAGQIRSEGIEGVIKTLREHNQSKGIIATESAAVL